MILADENIVAAVVQRLRADGWDVVSIAEMAPSIHDVDVLALAFRDGRVLLTDDKDFGELIVREGRPHRGIVLLRLTGASPSERADLVSRLFASAYASMHDAFIVVERDGHIHIRSIGQRESSGQERQGGGRTGKDG